MRNVFSTHQYDKGKGKNHIIFICDHASNLIPKCYFNLGLQKKLLRSHIALDIGAKNFSISISKALRQSCFYANFSRLLIDPNRNEDSEELIISNSWGQRIPGNQKISVTERKKRLKKFHNQYHTELAKFIKMKLKVYKNVKLIAIHSFTKKTEEFQRGIKIGLLFNDNINLLLEIQKKLEELKIHFGRNIPYSGYFYNYTLDKHSINGFLDNISIEIRNDLICNEKGIKKYTNLFKKILQSNL